MFLIEAGKQVCYFQVYLGNLQRYQPKKAVCMVSYIYQNNSFLGVGQWFLVNSIVPYQVRGYSFLLLEKCRIYAAFGVS